MARITYITHDGASRTVEVKNGLTVMQGAVKNNVAGIVAECGGQMICSTCHVYVDGAWLERVGQRSASEAELLDFVDLARPNSRLSCQIKVTDALDGLIVTTPESQTHV